MHTVALYPLRGTHCAVAEASEGLLLFTSSNETRSPPRRLPRLPGHYHKPSQTQRVPTDTGLRRRASELNLRDTPSNPWLDTLALKRTAPHCTLRCAPHARVARRSSRSGARQAFPTPSRAGTSLRGARVGASPVQPPWRPSHFEVAPRAPSRLPGARRDVRQPGGRVPALVARPAQAAVRPSPPVAAGGVLGSRASLRWAVSSEGGFYLHTTNTAKALAVCCSSGAAGTPAATCGSFAQRSGVSRLTL